MINNPKSHIRAQSAPLHDQQSKPPSFMMPCSIQQQWMPEHRPNHGARSQRGGPHPSRPDPHDELQICNRPNQNPSSWTNPSSQHASKQRPGSNSKLQIRTWLESQQNAGGKARQNWWSIRSQQEAFFKSLGQMSPVAGVTKPI
ncbi:hypothetical protein ACLOJK_026800 [Asimina triloba]